MKKLISVLIIIVTFLFFQIFMTGIAEKEIEENIYNSVDQVEELSVKASSFPAWEIITQKKVDTLKVKADFFVLNGLKFDSYQGKYKNVKYEDNVIDGKNTDLQLYLSEISLNNYMKENYKSFDNFKINLKPEDITLEGNLKILGQEISLKLNGDIFLKKMNIIVFKPGEFKVDDVSISLSFIKEFTGDLGFQIDLNKLAIPVNIEEIIIEDDRIELLGGSSARKAG